MSAPRLSSVAIGTISLRWRQARSMRHCQESAVVYMLQSGFSNAAPEVINIMDALKESMQAKGRAKLRDAVRRRMGEA